MKLTVSPYVAPGVRGQKTTLEMFQEYLDSLENTQDKLEFIAEAVCKAMETDMKQMRIKTRRREVSFPRKVAIYLMKEYTDASYKAIGRFFKRGYTDMDHTTIIHHHRVISTLLKPTKHVSAEEEQMKELIDKIIQQTSIPPQ